jgi:hypothetical protein
MHDPTSLRFALFLIEGNAGLQEAKRNGAECRTLIVS